MACVADHASIEAGRDKEEATWKQPSTCHVCASPSHWTLMLKDPAALQVEYLSREWLGLISTLLCIDCSC